MKKLFLAIISLFALVACKNNKDAKPAAMDIITLTDNGITYADTIVFAPCGKTISRDTATEFTEVDMGGTGTEHFVNATDKRGNTLSYNCTIRKTNKESVFTFIDLMASRNFPAKLVIANATGPANSIGWYKAKGTDTSAAARSSKNPLYIASSTFTETFKGGQQYTVDSVAVNITEFTATKITGSYQLWVTNTAGSKTVSGTIDSRFAATN